MSANYDYARFSRAECEEIFGPKSNSLKAAQMAKFQPDLYAALKQSSCYTHGIIAEAMLPRSSQLTREQLAEKARADAAKQKDELIEVPMQVCDRVGLPYGTKLSYENFTKAVMGRQHSLNVEQHTTI